MYEGPSNPDVFESRPLVSCAATQVKEWRHMVAAGSLGPPHVLNDIYSIKKPNQPFEAQKNESFGYHVAIIGDFSFSLRTNTR